MFLFEFRVKLGRLIVMYLSIKPDINKIDYLNNEEKNLLREAEVIHDLVNKEGDYWCRLNPTPKRKRIQQGIDDFGVFTFQLLISLSMEQHRKERIYQLLIGNKKYNNIGDILGLFHQHSGETTEVYNQRKEQIESYITRLANYVCS